MHEHLELTNCVPESDLRLLGLALCLGTEELSALLGGEPVVFSDAEEPDKSRLQKRRQRYYQRNRAARLAYQRAYRQRDVAAVNRGGAG